jgi:formate hydrogenlyase subunit 3/multisubunit Na+/H+ antiporter MnhD subunit
MTVIGLIILLICIFIPNDAWNQDQVLVYLGGVTLIFGGLLTIYQTYKDYFYNPKHGMTPQEE